MKKERRKSYRHPLLSEYVTYILGKKAVDGQSKMTDISYDGCFLELENVSDFSVGAEVILIFKLPTDLGMVYKDCIVKWVCWKKTAKRNNHTMGVGLEFRPVEEKHRKIWEAYITYLRNKQIIAVSKRIIEEFFDSGKKK